MKKRMTINIDCFLLQQIKFIAAQRHMTMTDYILGLVKKDLAKI